MSAVRCYWCGKFRSVRLNNVQVRPYWPWSHTTLYVLVCEPDCRRPGAS